MSFGYSISDVIAVVGLARTVWSRFQNSPSQFRAITTECVHPEVSTREFLTNNHQEPRVFMSSWKSSQTTLQKCRWRVNKPIICRTWCETAGTYSMNLIQYCRRMRAWGTTHQTYASRQSNTGGGSTGIKVQPTNGGIVSAPTWPLWISSIPV